MHPIIVVSLVSLLVAAVVVAAIAIPALKHRENDQKIQIGAYSTTLAPWEVDQQLPVIPAEMTTQAIPIVPLPSGSVLDKRDVVKKYPEATIGAHRQRKEFGAPTAFPQARHAR